MMLLGPTQAPPPLLPLTLLGLFFHPLNPNQGTGLDWSAVGLHQSLQNPTVPAFLTLAPASGCGSMSPSPCVPRVRGTSWGQ